MAVSILRETSNGDGFKTNPNVVKRVTFADEINTIITPAFSLTATVTPPTPPNTPNLQHYQHYHHYHHHHHHQRQQLVDQDQLSESVHSEHDTNTEGSTIVSRTSSRRLCRRCRRRNRRLAEEEERKRRRRHANGKEVFITKKRSSNDVRRNRRKDSKVKKSYTSPPSDADMFNTWYDGYTVCNNPNQLDDRRRSTSKKRSKIDEKDKENTYDNCVQTSNPVTKSEKKMKNKKKERTNGKSSPNLSKEQAAASKLDDEISRMKSTGVLADTRKFLGSFLGLDKSNRTMFDAVDARTLYKMLLEFRRRDCPKRLRVDGIRSRMIREEESLKALVKKRNEKTSEYIGLDKKENRRNRAKLEDFVISQLVDHDVEFLEEYSKSQLDKLSIRAVATKLRNIKDRARERNAR